jgi:hypothetical protein
MTAQLEERISLINEGSSTNEFYRLLSELNYTHKAH